MKIVGFNFTKINVEKLKDKIENLKINTKIDISDITDVKSSSFKIKEELLGVKFIYNIDYDPDFAKIELAGTLILGVESRIAKDVLKQWKTKKMPEDFRITLFNIILRKSSLKALILEEEMNLPLHIQLPSLGPKEKKE